VDKYSWVDIGSSYLPSDLIAAFLWAQMELAEEITQRRMVLWNEYHSGLSSLEQRGLLRRTVIPDHCEHNAHMYYILLPSVEKRTELIGHLKAKGIHSVFHYVPLHNSHMGLRHGRSSGELEHTVDLSQRLLRLPLWLGVEEHLEEIIEEIYSGLS
jgi:dTDP-4-amino-4,6-dideoxygalactose transaminase